GGCGIGHVLWVGARFLRAVARVLGIIEAAVGHDTPNAGVGFALVRSRSSMARCRGLREAGRDRGTKAWVPWERGRNASVAQSGGPIGFTTRCCIPRWQ